MSQYIYSASSTNVKLFDSIPSPQEEAIIGGILEGNRTTTSLIDGAINGLSWRMGGFFNYGKNHFVYGLPRDKTTTQVLSATEVDNMLEREESGPYVIERIDRVPLNAKYFTTSYIYYERDYNRYLNTVNPPNKFTSEIATELTSFSDTKRAELGTGTTALLSQLPVDRYRETSSTIEGEPVTYLDTYTVTHTVSYAEDYKEKVKHTYEGYTESSPVGGERTYTLDYLTTALLTYTGIGLVKYQEKRSRVIRYSDGSESSAVVTLFDPVTLEHKTGKQSRTLFYNQDESFTPVLDTDFLYYIVEYYILDIDGKKIPKYVFGLDGYSIDQGREFGAPVDTAIVTTGETDYYPIVPLVQNNVNMVGDTYAGSYKSESIKAVLKKLDLDGEALSASIQESPDIADIDEARFMLAVTIDTEEPASIRYLMRYFESVITTIPEHRRVNPDSNNAFVISDIIKEHEIHIEEGNTHTRINFQGIGERTVSGTIGKVGSVEMDFDFNGKHEKWFIREQVDKTTYKEVIILDALHRDFIYANGEVRTTIREAVEDDEVNNFIIPIKKSTADQLNTFELVRLFHDCAMIVIHAYEARKLKWYETGAFKAFLIVITIVTIYITGIDIYSVFTAAGTASAGIIAVAKLVLQKYLISIGLEYTVKLAGVEVTFVIAVAAFVSGVYVGTMGSTLANLNGVQLMGLSTMTANAIETNISKELADLQAEVSTFNDEANDLMDELEKKTELLDNSKIIDPMIFSDVRPYFDPNEIPSTFYQRTTQTNVAELSYSAIENFVDISLDLPKPTFN